VVCPFCPGNEGRTPPAILEVGAPWTVRVFPNRYPALMIEGGLDREGEGVYDRMNGVGAHEVLVETPHHDRALADLSPSEIATVLSACRDRVSDLKRDLRFRYVMVFKNHGAAAGATLPHEHSQLIALPTVPKNVADELRGSLDYFRFKERCLFCDIARQEVRDRRRVVHETAAHLVLQPWAPKFPFETWVLPRHHRAAFEDTPDGELTALASSLRVALRRLRRALDDPPYNFMIHSAPFGDHGAPFYHWYLEIIPSLTQMAGFEWGSGFFINPTPPEEAARFLREVGDDEQPRGGAAA
jgi:UDPglucose--hexose-1-phosphate uridylyltransferase